MHKSRTEYFSFFALFAAVAVLLFFVLAPFFSALALAAVGAALLRRPYEKLVKILFGKRTLSALLVVLAVLIFFIVPLFYFGAGIFHEAANVYTAVGEHGTSYTQDISTAIEKPVQRIYPAFVFNINSYLGNVLSFIAANLAAVVSGAIFIIFQTFLLLLAFFFFLRDGRKFVAALIKVSPFGAEQTDDVLTTMDKTVLSVIKGTFVVALIRWLCVGAAFYVLGIPNALLWGSLGGIVGAIPGVGAFVVFVPAVAYLYLKGSIIAAVAMAIVGIAVVVLVDNMLTPYFFGKDLAVPSIFILFAILGGILYFGPVGFILGPLVLVMFSSLLQTYPEIILDTNI